VWVNLYRPGNISFNALTGVCQPYKNRLMLMLKGSIQLGQVPELALNFDLMPVDFLARFIAFHASRYQPENAVFNLHNPEPLSWDAYVASFREAGLEFSLVSVADWQLQLGRVDSDNALFGVVATTSEKSTSSDLSGSSVHPNVRSKTMNNLQPDTLIKNPHDCHVESSVEVPASAANVWAVVGILRASIASFRRCRISR
jgi:thioester reductase-like protein